MKIWQVGNEYEAEIDEVCQRIAQYESEPVIYDVLYRPLGDVWRKLFGVEPETRTAAEILADDVRAVSCGK